jgi:hypothetical protein
MSYFAPVFGWRAHGMVKLAGLAVATPHLIVGVGGETVASSSPFMKKETDPVVYWGPGVSLAISDRWRVRIDLRHGLMAARDDGTPCSRCPWPPSRAARPTAQSWPAAFARRAPVETVDGFLPDGLESHPYSRSAL